MPWVTLLPSSLFLASPVADGNEAGRQEILGGQSPTGSAHGSALPPSPGP